MLRSELYSVPTFHTAFPFCSHLVWQVEDHLMKSAVAICSLTGPAIFLFAETFSCYTNEEDFELSCKRLYECNFTVSVHLFASALLFISSHITHRHINMTDIISLRNVDAGFIVLGSLQSLAWLIAMFLFGARPRDEVTTGDTEINLTTIATSCR